MQKRFNRPMEQIESRLSDGRQAARAAISRKGVLLPSTSVTSFHGHASLTWDNL